MRETCSLSKRLYMEPKKQCRNWTFIAYPESFPDAIDFLDEHHFEYKACLHDKCQYQNDDPDGKYKAGDLEKAHWHIVVKFSGNKTVKALQDTLDPRFCLLDYVDDIRGMVRYLIHADSPNKYQYSISDLIGPMNTDKYFGVQPDYTCFDFITDAAENEFRSVREAALFAAKSKNYLMLAFIQNNTYFIRQFLDINELSLEYARNDIVEYAKSEIKTAINVRLENLEKDFYGTEDIQNIIRQEDNKND